MDSLSLFSITNFIFAASGLFAVGSLILARKARQEEGRDSNVIHVHGSDAAWDQQVQGLLKSGSARLGLAQGMLVAIGASQNAKVLEHYSQGYSDSAILRKDALLTSIDLYCGKLVNANDILAIDYASLSRWRNHSAYRHFGVESYIGAPIHVNGKFFGVLSFFDERPRDNFFSASEKDLARELARRAEAILEKEEIAKGDVQENFLVEENLVSASAPLPQ